MKITRVGWIRKTDILNIHKEIDPYWENHQWGIPDIYIARLPKSSWDEEDWPPRKVLITVEDVE